MPLMTNIERAAMRIEEVRVYSKGVPVVAGTYRMSLSSVKALDSTIVEIVTNEEQSGWGETCPIGPLYQPHHMLALQEPRALVAMLDAQPINNIAIGVLCARLCGEEGR